MVRRPVQPARHSRAVDMAEVHASAERAPAAAVAEAGADNAGTTASRRRR